VPRSVVFPAQLRSFCVTERLGLAQELALPVASDVYTPPSIAGMALSGPSPPHSVRRLQRLTGAPGPFSAQRRTIFCTGPGMELCVVSPHQAPAPPRRIAMRGSRCGTETILARFRRPWKIGLNRLMSLRKSRTFSWPLPAAGRLG
jgi:hypothetical protein